MVDDNRLKFNTGVELSYLEPEEQISLHKFMETLNIIPSLEQASKLKKYSQEKNFNDAVIEIILTEEKEKGNNNITLKKKDLKQYFPKSYSKKRYGKCNIWAFKTVATAAKCWRKRRIKWLKCDFHKFVFLKEKQRKER